MKVVAQKQTKIILVISLILLLLIGLVVIFKDRIILFSKIKSFGKLDKYSHLVDDCEVEKKKGEVVLHCKGVLKRIRTDQEKKCLDFEFLINEDTDLREETLCIANDALDWDDSYGKAPWYIPTNITLSYKKESIHDYVLQKTTLQVMEDKELKTLFEKNKVLKNMASKIITKQFKHIFENKYHVAKAASIENTSISRTVFYQLTLKSISTVDTQLKLLFEMIVKNKRYDAVFSAQRLFHRDYNADHVTLLSPEDYSKLKIGKTYILMVLSSDSILPSNTEEKNCAEIRDLLPNTGEVVDNQLFTQRGFIFCTIVPKSLEDFYISNIAEYISSSIEKNNKKETQGVILDKFLPYLILSDI